MSDLFTSMLVAIDEISVLEARLEQAKRRAAVIEGHLLEQWGSLAKTKETRDGVTLYRRRDVVVSVKAGQAEKLRSALRQQRLGEMIVEQVDETAIRKFVRERVKHNDANELVLTDVPKCVLDHLNVFDKLSVRMRKA